MRMPVPQAPRGDMRTASQNPRETGRFGLLFLIPPGGLRESRTGYIIQNGPLCRMQGQQHV